MEDKNRKAMFRKFGLPPKIIQFEDPSHSYYKIPNKTLQLIGVKPSEYSKRGKTVTYVEEDGDMVAVVNALKKKKIHLIESDYKTKYYNDPNRNPARR